MHAAVESAKYQVAVLQELGPMLALVLLPPTANQDIATQHMHALLHALCPSLLDHTPMVVGAMLMVTVQRNTARLTSALPVVQILAVLVPVQVSAHQPTVNHQLTLANPRVSQIRFQAHLLSAASATTLINVLLAAAILARLMPVSPHAEEAPISILDVPALLHLNAAVHSASLHPKCVNLLVFN
jgi:hypothetical protein